MVQQAVEAMTYRDDDRGQPPRRVRGRLIKRQVPLLGYEQCLVDGVPVNPSTVRKAPAANSNPGGCNQYKHCGVSISPKEAWEMVSGGKPAFSYAKAPYDKAALGISRQEKANLPTEEVPVEQVVTVQSTVSPAKVQHFLDGGSAGPAPGEPMAPGSKFLTVGPWGVRTPDGKVYLEDGNTRGSAWVIQGRKTIPLKVVDVGEDGKWKGKSGTANSNPEGHNQYTNHPSSQESRRDYHRAKKEMVTEWERRPYQVSQLDDPTEHVERVAAPDPDQPLPERIKDAHALAERLDAFADHRERVHSSLPKEDQRANDKGVYLIRSTAEKARAVAGALQREHERRSTVNAFCPTGPGGGVNPHCSPGQATHTQSGLPVGHIITGAGKWRGYTLSVTPAGLEVLSPNGSTKTYTSLTAAAQGIKGSNVPINGRAFFGLGPKGAPIPPSAPASPLPVSPAPVTPATPAPAVTGMNRKVGLPVGHTFSKTYPAYGTTYHLEVTATGLKVTDTKTWTTTHYGSLTAAAQGIKGSSVPINGRAFFGIGPKTSPAVSLPGTGQTSTQTSSGSHLHRGASVIGGKPSGGASTIPFSSNTEWEIGKPKSGQVLNGIPLEPVADHKFWEKTPDVDVKEPKALNPIVRVGIMIKEPDGRVWIAQPTNGYGKRKYTLPGGTIEKGLSMQQNALKETWEETGLHVKITGHLGDFGDSNFTDPHTGKSTRYGRLYLGERIGGAPWDAKQEASIPASARNGSKAESEAVNLVTPEEAAKLLHRTDDLAQLATVAPIKLDTKPDGNVMRKIVEGIQPVAHEYARVKSQAGAASGNSELHAVQKLRGFDALPTQLTKKEMDDLVSRGGYIEMLRGVKRHDGKGSGDLAKEFKSGELFPGFGIFGSGTYADATKGYGNVATGQYGAGGDVIRMALPKTAKIIQQSELEKMVPGKPSTSHQAATGMGDEEENWRGVQAALAGYDAIHVDGKSQRHGTYGNRNHSKTEGFYVILNRSILSVQKESAKGHRIS